MDLVGDAEVVLLGEVSHGTHEFYQIRADITRRLIEEKGFTGIAVEGDWPDCYRVNRYVRGLGSDRDARSALGDFRRFPIWMWRNTVVQDFVAWLRRRNESRAYHQQAGFYGLDMYSLYTSAHAVIDYLGQVDPDAAVAARERYGCFDHLTHLREDAQQYGYNVRFGIHKDCEDEVVEQLLEMEYGSEEYLKKDGMPVESRRVRPGLPGSHEELMHDVDMDAFFLPMRNRYPEEPEQVRLERAIGVIYRPETERQSHYCRCNLPHQFDGVIHIDETRALKPLDDVSEWEHGQAETYPFGV